MFRAPPPITQTLIAVNVIAFALEALQALFARPVDLLTPANLANPYLKQRVEQEKTLLYAA